MFKLNLESTRFDLVLYLSPDIDLSHLFLYLSPEADRSTLYLLDIDSRLLFNTFNFSLSSVLGVSISCFYTLLLSDV